MPIDEFITVAEIAANRADAIAMKYFRSEVAVEIKPDQSPVTIADREAERAIVETISSRFPDHGFYGEEYGRDNADRDYVWIIDPIDGTKSFIRGIPLFGAQIALMRAGELLLGISSMPAMNERLIGVRGRGATLNGRPIRVSAIAEMRQAAVCFATLNHFRGLVRGENLLEMFELPLRTRAYGDCYGFHLVADGRFDVVIESRINIYDIAALVAVIEAAGGRCSEFDGKPIGMESANVVASNGLLHEQALALLNRQRV